MSARSARGGTAVFREDGDNSCPLKYACRPTPRQTAQRASTWLSSLIARHQAGDDRPFSIALAGGSTPKQLYQLLADRQPAADPIDWRRVWLLWGDERNVPADHPDSNYRMVRENLLDRVSVPCEQVLPVPDSGGDPRQAAEAYERLLRGQLPTNPAGWPEIDCVLLGLGDDVHTASLFPNTEAVQETARWVAANHVPHLDGWRITLTLPAINAAHRVAFLICGASKSAALRTLWHGPRDGGKYPAQLIKPASGQLYYFLDTAALGEVNPPEPMVGGTVSR